MQKILKIEKIENRFKDPSQMMNSIYVGQISEIEQKISSITFISFGMTYATLIIFIINNSLNFGILLIVILGTLLILLYRTIMYDIIITDKAKQIYKKAYYVYGYILTESSTWYLIDEIFFDQKEADDFFLSLMDGIFLKQRKCFKCKKEMNYIHYHRNNISEMSTLQLEKIWKSNHIQIFCCKCVPKNYSWKNIIKYF